MKGDFLYKPQRDKVLQSALIAIKFHKKSFPKKKLPKSFDLRGI